MSWNNLVGRNLKPLMLEQGENPKVVQEVLGHSSITHTTDTYSYVSPNIQKEALGRLSKRLEGPCIRPPCFLLRSNGGQNQEE